MTDKLEKQQPPTQVGDTGISTQVGTNGKTHIHVGLPKLHQQAREAEKEAAKEDTRAAEMPNRIALMLDCSASMNGNKIQTLREACVGFVEAADFSNTAVAVATFGLEDENGRGCDEVKPLVRNVDQLRGFINSLKADGSTPMHACLSRAIEEVPLTRGVVVSDGEATDWPYRDCNNDVNDEDFGGVGGRRYPVGNLAGYLEMHIPVDTVHIGLSTNGEELLEFIAKRTGGIFIKFKDIASFGRALKYLSPKFRALLNSGDAAKLLGATEVKR